MQFSVIPRTPHLGAASYSFGGETIRLFADFKKMSKQKKAVDRNQWNEKKIEATAVKTKTKRDENKWKGRKKERTDTAPLTNESDE